MVAPLSDRFVTWNPKNTTTLIAMIRTVTIGKRRVGMSSLIGSKGRPGYPDSYFAVMFRAAVAGAVPLGPPVRAVSFSISRFFFSPEHAQRLDRVREREARLRSALDRVDAPAVRDAAQAV